MASGFRIGLSSLWRRHSDIPPRWAMSRQSRLRPMSALALSGHMRRRPLHSCGSSNTSLSAMKTMAPIIAAKNMAGKEAVDSSMRPRVLAPASLHNAIVCANRWFCWQRQHDHEATAALRHFPLEQGRPETLLELFHQQVSQRIPT